MLKAAENVASTRGFVKTLSGRRIRFHDKNTTYKAAGLVFQGSSADLGKKKLVELDNAFKNTGSELILMIHDEFCILSEDGNVEKDMKMVKEIVEDIPELRIPIRSDVQAAENWHIASK